MEHLISTNDPSTGRNEPVQITFFFENHSLEEYCLNEKSVTNFQEENELLKFNVFKNDESFKPFK